MTQCTTHRQVRRLVCWFTVVLGTSMSPTMRQASAETGLAARYPGDQGIEQDPAVLFHEDFERGRLDRWDNIRGHPVLTNLHPHAGRYCVRMEMQRGSNTGADLKKWFAGADRVFVRFYVKFSPDHRYLHHFVTLLANEPGNRWAAFGKAGTKPDGRWFCSGMEPWFAWGRNPPPGELMMYSYFLDMDMDPKMRRYWGNMFFPPGPDRGRPAQPTRVLPALGRWQCWEFMIEANRDADHADGRQAMWLDGRQIAEFTGLRWRLGPELKINCLWLQYYGMDESDPTREHWPDQQWVCFDDVVVATEYIGPMRP